MYIYMRIGRYAITLLQKLQILAEKLYGVQK
jgi:hypothetical protein